MSNEPTQLRARVAADNAGRVLRNCFHILTTQGRHHEAEDCNQAWMRLTAIFPAREADTKPLVDERGFYLVDPADVEAIAAALTIANRKTDAFDAAWAAVSRIRQALQPQADRSPIPDQGATPCKGCGKSPCGSHFVSVDDDESQGET